ncbi:OprD family outer membrane porin [Sulfurimonas microaerophilic]|uniref:OprD family outer membrane porin n=1 Tax=Sulfurimonas microaerophilic TaxID=3058392 RepID=UPI002715538C|nr:OprD family outer membrane porin [Sulfurimonas sp. hsl 1-7]
MKLGKISLAAAALLSANLYAIDNLDVSGSASLFYGSDAITYKDSANQKMFNNESSYADLGINVGATVDLTKGVTAGAAFQGVTTLGGLNNVWSGAHPTTGSQVDPVGFFSEAWIAATYGKTTAKVGRQELNTPLVFTSTWNITTNTFEAAVVTNEDIPNTTLMGAWIGTSNGYGDDVNQADNIGNVTSVNGKFNTFGEDNAYVVGVTNNSYAPLTAQAWYYDIRKVAKAYWLQADLDMDGVLAGAQYVNVNSDTDGDATDSAYGLMLGYSMKDVGTVKVAYSSVDDEGTFGVANYATRDQGAGAGSSLYTEMWWWFGTVSQAGADTIALSAETTVSDIDLFLGYYSCDIKPTGSVAGDNNSVDEIAFTASKSFGPVDSTVALVHDRFGYKGGTSTGDMEDYTTFQVYLTYNF